MTVTLPDAGTRRRLPRQPSRWLPSRASRGLRRRAVLGVGATALALLVGATSVRPAVGVPVSHVVSNGPRTERIVALTFDDGSDPEATGRIVAILEERHVPATFFPVAGAVAASPGLWRSIAEAGFGIGNHSISHPDLTTLSAPSVYAQILGARRTIERSTGRPMLPLFRPPYGRYDDRTLALARAAGFPTVVLWDTAGLDWELTDPAEVTRHALDVRPGSILLLHTWPSATAAALPGILDGLAANGFRIVPLTELIAGS